MLYFSRNSRRRILHSPDCRHIKNVEIDSVGTFETLSEAYGQGYRLCRRCSCLRRRYGKELTALMDFSRKNALCFCISDRFLQLNTPSSRWRLAPAEDGRGLCLYHKNSLRPTDDDSPVPGYHLQRVLRSSIVGYCKYIVAHDSYRMANPLHIPPQPSPPPRKGTKRYRKQQKQQKRLAKRRAIANVLSMIDQLALH